MGARLALEPTVTNPGGNALTHAWTQTGGATFSVADAADTVATMPEATDVLQQVEATLTVTDDVTLEEAAVTIKFSVVPEPAVDSIFHAGVGTATAGVVWHGLTVPQADGDGNLLLVDSADAARRADVAVAPSYLDVSPGYVAKLSLQTDGGLALALADTADAADSGAGAGPQLTHAAHRNLGLALMLPGGTTRQWSFSELTASDALEPYAFSAASVAGAGQANDQALRDLLAGSWMVRLVLVNRAHPQINWDDLQMQAAPVPAPPAGQAEILPALRASVEGGTQWPGGLVAEVESYGATMFGGPEAATLNAAGPETALRWLLTQLRRPLHLHGKQAGTVWWGYVHRVEVRLGAVMATASLDGLRTAIAVTYTDAETGAADRSEFHVAQPVAEQFGRIEILGEAENADGATEAALAELLAPHLAVARGVEVSGQPATGARLYARGWNAALNWRFAPRHSDHARFGDAARQGTALGRPAIGTGAEEVEWAAWCDFGPQGHPGYDLYLHSARLAITGPAENAETAATAYSDTWAAGVRRRTRGMDDDPAVNDPTASDEPAERIGKEIAFDAAVLPRVNQSTPYDVLNGEMPGIVELDFGSQEILLPEAGFFLTVRAALTHPFQYAVADEADDVWRDDTPGAAWSWGHDGSAWTQAGTQRPVYDFTVRARATGLLRMLLDGHDILRAGPAPDGVGAQTYALHAEGGETVAQRLAEVRKAERPGYVVDATRTVRFFAGGESDWRLGRDGRWQSKVARGAMPFLGQFVRTADGGTALCESATFTPRTGLWELGYG